MLDINSYVTPMACILLIYAYIRFRGLEYILFHYRWVLVLFIIIPLSLAYDTASYLRARVIFWRASAPGHHADKVAKVRRQVRQWDEDGRPGGHMCTARPGWMTMCFRRPKYKKSLRGIEVNMVDILKLDEDKGLVTVEPLCTVGQLSALLTPLGWGLAVTPELDDLTIGGLINGFGVESSSHRFGLLQHCVVSMEVVLGDGTLVSCSANENPDLFYALPMSHGTLGFLVSAEIRLQRVKPFVKITFQPVSGLDAICSQLEKESRGTEGNEFVECLMFSLDTGVIVSGNMTAQVDPDKLNSIGKFYKPWFYKHVEAILQKNVKTIEYIPYRDYLHRHSKALFWEMEKIVPFGNNAVFRYLLGWTMPPKISFLKITQSQAVKRLYEKHHMEQDFMVPMANLEGTLRTADRLVSIYPVWLCPFRVPHGEGFMHPPTAQSDGLYVDVGLYGMPPPHVQYDRRDTTRRLEDHVTSVDGYQMLYADCYRTADEFREMFDHRLYDRVKATWIGSKREGAFPELFEKVSRYARD